MDRGLKSPKFVSLRPERKSFMSYVHNDFTSGWEQNFVPKKFLGIDSERFPLFRRRKCSFRGISSSAEEPIPKLGTEQNGTESREKMKFYGTFCRKFPTLDFTVRQKILETKWISLRKEVGQKIRQIYQAHFKSTGPCKHPKVFQTLHEITIENNWNLISIRL